MGQQVQQLYQWISHTAESVQKSQDNRVKLIRPQF